jgi:hypothetical protein
LPGHAFPFSSQPSEKVLQIVSLPAPFLARMKASHPEILDGKRWNSYKMGAGKVTKL